MDKERLNAWRRNNLKMCAVYLNKNNPEDRKFIEIFDRCDKTPLIKRAVAEYVKNHPDYVESHRKGSTTNYFDD